MPAANPHPVEDAETAGVARRDYAEVCVLGKARFGRLTLVKRPPYDSGMTKQFRFGSASTVSYTPRSELLCWDGPRGEAIADVGAATAAALAQPIEFPPLRQAVVPGDKIVLALEPDVPQAASIVAAVVAAVIEAGASPEDITILRAEDDRHSLAKDPRAQLPAAHREQVQMSTHHPAARGDLSYLAADEHDRPIYVSRRLLDADVVVPIGCVRLDESLGYGGARATLYPTFSDQDARLRCRAAVNGASGIHGDAPAMKRSFRRASDESAPSGRTSKRRSAKGGGGDAAGAPISQSEADHVAWLLGVAFTIQAVPGRAEDVLHLLAGRVDEVLRRGGQLCREAWAFEVPARASLVVAAIDGDADQQTWDNVGRAVAAAQRVVQPNGTIALCTELADAPGPALRTAAAAESWEQAQRRIHKQKTPDIPTAEQWARARDVARLYLLSRLDESEVERLGAAHVESAAEVTRLIDRTDSCVLLTNAQYVLPTALDE